MKEKRESVKIHALQLMVRELGIYNGLHGN